MDFDGMALRDRCHLIHHHGRSSLLSAVAGDDVRRRGEGEGIRRRRRECPSVWMIATLAALLVIARTAERGWGKSKEKEKYTQTAVIALRHQLHTGNSYKRNNS